MTSCLGQWRPRINCVCPCLIYCGRPTVMFRQDYPKSSLFQGQNALPLASHSANQSFQRSPLTHTQHKVSKQTHTHTLKVGSLSFDHLVCHQDLASTYLTVSLCGISLPFFVCPVCALCSLTKCVQEPLSASIVSVELLITLL